MNLFNSVVGNGIVANSRIFNILVYAYAKGRMMVEAMLIFSEMRVQGVCPDVCTYSTVIASLCRMGGLAAAMGKLDETNFP
jgi:leucine-rich PPR motif-containing protein